MLTATLKSLAEIQTGYTFRTKITPQSRAGIPVVQSKNVSTELFLTEHDIDLTVRELSHSTAFVKTGDIVFTSRGKFQAAVIKSTKPLLASSSVFIIRVNAKKIHPDYLAIALNSDSCQKQLHLMSRVGTIQTVTKQNISELKISVPPLEKQRLLVALYINIALQKKLLTAKMERVESIFNSVLDKYTERTTWQ